jgi:uncharacterized protein YgiB involved in biofilm formation
MSGDALQSFGGYKVWGAIFIAVVSISLAAAIMMRRPQATVMVFATPQDCLRVFDHAKCQDIVHAALKVHFAKAPSFASLDTCEWVIGVGTCIKSPASGASLESFAPAMVAVLAAHDGDGGAERHLVPVYVGQAPNGKVIASGQPVYFAGTFAGYLVQRKFGGARLSQLLDRTGKSATDDTLFRIQDLHR